MMGINTNAPVKTNRSSYRSSHEQQANLATPVTSYSFRDGEFVTIFRVQGNPSSGGEFLTCGRFKNVVSRGEFS
jgi:hypothetical protein